ncbi:MAG TPA: hypothetical protein VJQ47_13585 [Steroidobacteraceae bacterium]|nr:hypothetical protein [Steroidobacteraceae bacterium]
MAQATERVATEVRRRGLATVLLVAMPCIALVPKCLLVAHALGASGAHIFDTGFGFGAYVHALFTDGAFRSCHSAPFKLCDPDVCVYATRQPLLPLLYAALAKLVGTKSAAVAIAKCAVTTALLTGFLLTLSRDLRPGLFPVILIYALYFGPQTLKHQATLDYEEGLLIDLEACLAIAALYLIRPTLTANDSRRAFMGVAAVVLATALYFVKTTALPMLLVIIALMLRRPELTARVKVISALCVLAPFAAWGAHNYAFSRGIHLSSSWNGENLYRGSSSEGLALYPQVLLDRLFDSRQAVLEDGRVVELHDLENRRCFVNEWEWNDYYGDLARAWWREHPLDALRFTWNRIWVGLFELRHTPYRTLAEGGDTEYPPAVSAVMSVWMGFARLLFLALVTFIVRDLWQGNRERPLWTLALVAAGWLPYILVFAYQRHVVPLLLMAGLLLLGLYLSEPRRQFSSM